MATIDMLTDLGHAVYGAGDAVAALDLLRRGLG